MTNNDTAIGARLSEVRKAVHLSQSDLASAVARRGHKWSQATVWAVESGKRPLRLSEAIAIAGVTGVEVGALVPDGCPVEVAPPTVDDLIADLDATVQQLKMAHAQ